MQPAAGLGRDSPPTTVPRCLIVSMDDGTKSLCHLLPHLGGSSAELIQSKATSRSHSTQIIAVTLKQEISCTLSGHIGIAHLQG